MRSPLFAFLVIEVVRLTMCVDNCDRLGTIIYEDIGCSPIYKDGQSCPVKYECEDFNQNNDTCRFRGKSYNVDEEVEENLTYESCYVACRCQNPTSDERYLCAVLDCPEWLDGGFDEDCYRKYDIDKCCSIGLACPKKEKVETCEYEGKRYQEGEIFFPENTCIKCSCQKGFQGKIEEPFCKRNMCALQILHSGKLEKSCAPLYFHYASDSDSALCCPNEWICPTADEDVVKTNPNVGVDLDSDLTCKFGSNSLKLGEGFDRRVEFYGKERNVTCECILPPLLTCKEA